jgi:hypothetical protein
MSMPFTAAITSALSTPMRDVLVQRQDSGQGAVVIQSARMIRQSSLESGRTCDSREPGYPITAMLALC